MVQATYATITSSFMERSDSVQRKSFVKSIIVGMLAVAAGLIVWAAVKGCKMKKLK